MMKRAALLACLVASSPQAGPADGIAAVEVLPGWQTATGTHMAALRITLSPGWKTYWRAPGDGGIPPQINFGASENVAAAQFHWPTPDVMDQDGLRTIGYYDGVTVPVELTPNGTGPLRLTGTLDIGVCEEICVPVRLSFDADLPLDGARNSAIIASLIDRPTTAAEAGVSKTTCAITPIADGLTVTATMTMPATGGDEHVVIEAGNPLVWVSEADVVRQGNQITATSDMVHANVGPFALDRSAIRITVFGSDSVVDIQGCTSS